jgi:hypothetical protein
MKKLTNKVPNSLLHSKCKSIFLFFLQTQDQIHKLSPKINMFEANRSSFFFITSSFSLPFLNKDRAIDWREQFFFFGCVLCCCCCLGVLWSLWVKSRKEDNRNKREKNIIWCIVFFFQHKGTRGKKIVYEFYIWSYSRLRLPLSSRGLRPPRSYRLAHVTDGFNRQ